MSIKAMLTDGLGRRRMTREVLGRIMDAHVRTPGQPLRFWKWRHGPGGTTTIYDYSLPRRAGVVTFGYSDEEWTAASVVCNVSDDSMGSDAEVANSTGTVFPGSPINPRPTDTIRPGYRKVLTQLLTDGCIVPSNVLDAWLGFPSRQICDNDLRVQYRHFR